MMYTNNGYNQYREQSVMTAGPGELVLMLYDGCLKQIRLARLAITENMTVERNNALQRGQEIVGELINTLDFDFELSNSLYALYDYFLNEMISANVENSSEKLDNIEALMIELRETWQEMVKQQKSGSGSAASL